MELPSMVQRSGDTLIVRSVVSGNQLYLDQGGATKSATSNSAGGINVSSAAAHTPSPSSQHYQHRSSSSSSALEQQFEMFRAAAAAAQQQHYLQQQHHQQQGAVQTSQQQAAAAALELKDEGLPQCKIKRNYSCSYCTYFTQNPRYHLTHLRDVHGEKIVINKCKLCLYASRHFQKLVRHMKMVHGCTDGIAGGHGQSRGKRGMSREARKRKLEASVGLGAGVGVSVGNVVAAGMPEMPSLEEVKRELELQQAAFHKQQEEQKTQQLLANHATNAIIAAYGQQLRERELESLKARTAYEQQQQEATAVAAAAAADVQRHRQSPTNNNNNKANNNNAGFPLPPATNRNLELSPSPIGSVSSPSPAALGGTPSSSSTPTPHTSAALSLTYADEPPQNRLLKCSICDFTTLYRAQLMSHELEEHCKTKFFRCEKCSYVTHIKTRFSKHVKYHSMPMIKCVTCDFRTPYKWNLDRHMKNHGGAGPFKCAACDFTADIKQSLTVHEMNHHVPPVGHAAGMSLARRRNKVGGTDLCDDFLSDSAEMLDDHYNNNNLDEYDEALLAGGDVDVDGAVVVGESYSKKCKYDEDEPTDLSQKGGSSDTSSVHNQAVTPKAKRPVPNLIPIPKVANNVLNLSKDLTASRSSLTEIASMFFSEKQLSEMLQPLDKSEAPQLSPTTTITSTSSHQSRSLLHKKPGSFFDKLKSSALTNSGSANENLMCPCGHMAKCLSESIIHRKTCKFAAIADDDIEEEQDDGDGRLEIDFAADDDDKQSHSALNLVTGSTRCQHCRHRCKSSADLLNHMKQCTEAARCGHESYDSMSGESSGGRGGGADSAGEQALHPMENRVFIWNKLPRSGGSGAGGDGSQCSDAQQRNSIGESSAGSSSGGGMHGNNEENSYYGVETAPGYGEVTKKMTPEEEAANSSLKKVYKCPHCSFWASTASRFHVHIVGHLNKKPFECSLCSYRSNWRWDITKHIRLKTIRDPSHKNARVLMNDETGRRNYTKYNKYITLMKVTEEDGDPKLMKSGEMTPNQVASLSFLNDLNKSGSGTSGGGSHSGSAHFNGLRDDVTLEPVMSTKSSTHVDSAGEHIASDRFIRLPMLATMVNAAMTRQQQQQKKQHEHHATLITPSVTISAVKRSPTHLMKPSDDLVTDVKQEGNEKKTFYRCRKCSFRHGNRDAVLAHVRVHYQDLSYASALTASPKAVVENGQQQPLQVAVNSNLYNMNEVLAAMCLSQQQQQQQQQHNSSSNTTSTSNTQQQSPHSMLSAGLLQQAIQGASNASANSPLSGLALALTGKSPTKMTAASILEHGEQKASQNEASAPRRPPPTSPSTTHTHAAAFGGSSIGAAATSLQHLLSSPRDHHNTHHHALLAHNPLNSPPTTTTTLIGAGINSNLNHNSNLVMGLTAAGAGTGAIAVASSNSNSPTASQQAAASLSTLISPRSPTANAGTPIVTTLPTTPSGSGGIKATAATTPHSAKQLLAFGGIASPRLPPPTSSAGVGGAGTGGGMPGLIVGDSVCFGGLVYGSNSSTLICNSTTITTPTTISTPTTTTSCNLLSNSSATAAAAAAALAAKNPSSFNASSSSSCASASSPPSSASAANFINNNNLNNCNSNSNIAHNNANSNNLLSNDSERRDPSPYRCGHCHQVSNWKHVIQRHCRLKHAGDIRIETLDRAACVERSAAPIYRPLGNGASNETNNYGLNFKALQHQHQHQQANINSNNNNSVLINKNEHLLHSPLAASAAAAVNAASTPQDLQAAAAYLAAAYKAATASAAGGAGSAEELLLQQNDQIEITRMPSAAASSNLAQLLEGGTGASGSGNTQQNSKCKQQKCPLCPYISESKSQMNYHISLHKPTQYECPLCTFVCAKKQHLSSHMRSVHQQQQQQHSGANSGVNLGVNAAGLNMDFSMALHLAAAAQAQQDGSSLSAPLAIDLTALKHTLSSNAAGASSSSPQIQNQAAQQPAAPTDQQQAYKLVSYCAKCPVRYAQKHSEMPRSRAELEEHMKYHLASSENSHTYKCEFCDFKAPHDTLIQTHRYVHSQHYQDKCAELYHNCKEDVEHPAPKLMQITLTKNLQTPEAAWIVDLELSTSSGGGGELKQQQQNASISSSSSHAATANFDGGNSLLKKQLEAGPAPIPSAANSGSLTCHSPASPMVKPPQQQEAADDSCSNTTPSTSASVATSDLAVDASSDFNSAAPSPALLEKCLHCPFETTNAALYKSHLQQHGCISHKREAYICEHCDYSDASKQHIEEHTRVHFNAMEKLKSVAFFTSYDNLELSVEKTRGSEEETEQNTAQTNNAEALENPVSIKQEQEQTQEHNNNNEEDAINENMLQERQLKEQYSEQPTEAQEKAAASESHKKTCNKIILYKNDGLLSIKKDSQATASNTSNNNNNTSNSGNSDNISDRLRRRISRSSNSHHLNGGSEEHHHQHHQQPPQQQSHKTILVNAKTGQVISRN